MPRTVEKVLLRSGEALLEFGAFGFGLAAGEVDLVLDLLSFHAADGDPLGGIEG